jgi:hypothetical protein
MVATLSKPTSISKTIQPGSFQAHKHWYPKALNAAIHRTVNFFLNLDQERIITRYCHLHPMVWPDSLRNFLNYETKYFHWAGADLINVTSAGGKRQMVVIENNSCPSGQKSMPLTLDHQEQGNYRWLIENTFQPFLEKKRPIVKGGLAVVFDKNHMEASGYAAVMADVFDEPVYLAEFHDDEKDPAVRFDNGVMFVRAEEGEWKPIRAAFRYVTQKPWNRIPISTKTRILNPVLACLAGGRNKMLAAKAYEIFNTAEKSSGLKINTPETIRDVRKQDIPGWVEKMGGHAVVKVPYSNAGQGVYTIVTPRELEEFMMLDFDYDCFIVQSLIGNYNWSSNSTQGKLYHVGTIPNEAGETYVADLRMMVSSTPKGILPLCIYARQAAKPLENNLLDSSDSWSILGTNLSIKNPDGTWDSDTNRLILMDRRDFNRLGVGLDDLIEGYIQTVLSMVAIDRMACELVNKKGQFRMQAFQQLNDDEALINEIFP